MHVQLLYSTYYQPEDIKRYSSENQLPLRVSGGANVFTRPAKKNDPGEFDGILYRGCLQCGDDAAEQRKGKP